jgi:cGMP-dependent protein kinase 2
LQVIAQRLSKLGTFKKSGAPERQPAEVLIKRRKRGRSGEITWEMVRARGHLDEVLEMRKGGTKLGELCRHPAGTAGTFWKACRLLCHGRLLEHHVS